MAYTLILGSLDLTQYTRVAYGEGMDPANSEFSTPQFADSPFSDGQALISRSYGNKGQGYPLFLKAASKDLLHDLITQIELECKKKVRLEFRDDGASDSTFFDVESAKLEHDFNFRRSQARHAQAVLRVWTRPFGHDGSYTTIATAQGSGAFLAVPLPVVEGDEAAQLEGYVRVGSTLPTYGRIAGLGVAQPSRLLRFPAGSFVPINAAGTLTGATAVQGSQAYRGGWGFQILANTASPMFRLNLSPASLYEGRQRIFALARNISLNVMQFGVVDQPYTLATARDWALHDLGVVDVQPGRSGTYSIDVFGGLPPGYNVSKALLDTKDALGDGGRWVSTGLAPGALDVGEVYVVPEDSTVVMAEHAHRMIAADRFARDGLLANSIDSLGNRWVNMESTDGFRTLAAQRYAYHASYAPTYAFLMALSSVEPESDMRIRATVNRTGTSPSAMVGVAKVAVDSGTGLNRIECVVVNASGNANLFANIRGDYGGGPSAPSVLASAAISMAVASANAGRMALEMRTRDNNVSFHVWVGPTLAASIGAVASFNPIIRYPGYPGIVSMATTNSFGWQVEGFDAMAGPPAAGGARSYLRFHDEEGITGGPDAGTDDRRLDKWAHGRVPRIPVGSTPAVAFAFNVTDESTRIDVLDVDIRVRERFTYMR